MTIVHHEKRSIRWDQDPVILSRLKIIADLMNQRMPLHDIAMVMRDRKLPSSMATINRDVARVRELWRRDSLKDIDDKRAESLAQFRRLQKEAWDQLNEAKRRKRNTVPTLRLIAEIEEKISKLEGTVVTRLDMTSRGESIANRDPRQLSESELEALAGLSPEASELG